MREPDAGRRSAARRRSRGQAKGRGPKAAGSELRAGGALGRTRSQGAQGELRAETERMILLHLGLPC